LNFTIYPAIDLRRGQVVRLQQGDPARQKEYSRDPGAAARRWLEDGAHWLHVVNLDGAFGETDALNRAALERILEAAGKAQAQVQFGGGLRSLEGVRSALEMGAARVVLGTVVVEQPHILHQALELYGPERVAAGLDARDGIVQVRGWAESGAITAMDLAARLKEAGLQWLIFTDIARDGLGTGLNLAATLGLAQATGLRVVASGGVSSAEDVLWCQEAGLAGVIIGHALYEGKIDLRALIQTMRA
jgi:phosphoribosylformimino-5-aminoimidazole carboxamide ribotide isomerase